MGDLEVIDARIRLGDPIMNDWWLDTKDRAVPEEAEPTWHWVPNATIKRFGYARPICGRPLWDNRINAQSAEALASFYRAQAAVCPQCAGYWTRWSEQARIG